MIQMIKKHIYKQHLQPQQRQQRVEKRKTIYENINIEPKMKK